MKTVSRKGDGFFCVLDFGFFNASCPEIRVNKTSLFFNAENEENEENAERTLRLELCAVLKCTLFIPFNAKAQRAQRFAKHMCKIIPRFSAQSVGNQNTNILFLPLISQSFAELKTRKHNVLFSTQRN